MARYRIDALSYIGNRLVQPGEVIEYDGRSPGKGWQRIKDDKPAPAKAPAVEQDKPTDDLA